jgi:hypothetical protein
MTRRVWHARLGILVLVGLILLALGASGGHYAELWRPVP